MERPRRVLVIDDNQGILSIAIAAFELAGWEIATALSGQEGVKLAGSFEPDVVLLDVMMPVMDGWMTLEHLRRAHPDLPVMFLTARVLEHEIASYEQHVEGVIRKPFDVMAVPAQVSAVVFPADQRD